MWAAIKQFLAPPVFEGNEDKTRSAQLLNTLLYLVLAGVIFFTISVLFTLQNEIEPLVLIIAIVLGLVTIVLFILLRQGFVLPVGITLALTMWIGFSIPMFTFAGIHDSAITGYFFIIAMVGVVAGWRSLLFFTIITAAALISSYYTEQVGIFSTTIPLPSKIDDLILLLLMLGSTALILWYAVQRISGAYERLRQNAKILQTQNQDLERARETVEFQAQELAQRSHYLATTAAIAQESAALLDTPLVMMHHVAETISDAFDYNLVSIFLVDSAHEWAELVAASSEIGQELIERNYRLRVGSGWAGEGIVGNVAGSGKTRVVRDVTRDEFYVDTSELPNTISEIAFPLIARGIVIGVLDIQSKREETFSPDEVELLQGLANQVSLAVDNARQVERMHTATATQKGKIGILSRDTWAQILQNQERAVVSDAQGTVTREIAWYPDMVTAIQTGQTISNKEHTKVTLPIISRDQVIGVIDAQLPATEGEWTIEQLATLQAISEQLSTALESAQLYNTTQQRAAREILSREIADKMRKSISWEELLQTTLQEISQVLGVSRAFVQWSAPDSDNQRHTNHKNLN